VCVAQRLRAHIACRIRSSQVRQPPPTWDATPARASAVSGLVGSHIAQPCTLECLGGRSLACARTKTHITEAHTRVQNARLRARASLTLSDRSK
jgi:hypothetical protein